jgi:aerobic-type carbon monoxide dehydrogenase small subunit (CoxS/CutS family)
MYMHKKEEYTEFNKSSISCKEFIPAGSAATGFAAHAHTAKEAEKPPRTIKLTVNGRKHEFIVGYEVKPNTTLRDLLRERLGLTSIKDMCLGEGACGSCSVIVDGRPVLSCLTLAMDCDGKIIETAEGIADSGHPIIDAFIRNVAFQCGYCTPGFVVTAKALLNRNPKPTINDIKEALSGNLCRCGSYLSIIKAVQEASDKLLGKR